MVWHCQAGTGAWCDIVTWGDIGDMIKPWFPGHVTNVTMSHHAPVPAWQCHTMSHQSTLTLNTPILGNHGFIMSPMSLCHTMHLCHTMSHQATLTLNTPRPGNHGFIMSPMSLCHTMHLCHTMSHRQPPDQETTVLSCHQCHTMHLCQPGSATSCHIKPP